MVEKMNLVILGCAQNGGSDEDGRDVQNDAGDAHQQKSAQNRKQRRDHRHQSSRGAAEYQQERKKYDRRGQREALNQARNQAQGDLIGEHALADHAPAYAAQRGSCSCCACQALSTNARIAPGPPKAAPRPRMLTRALARLATST
jgi:hypothetical protein